MGFDIFKYYMLRSIAYRHYKIQNIEKLNNNNYYYFIKMNRNLRGSHFYSREPTNKLKF